MRAVCAISFPIRVLKYRFVHLTSDLSCRFSMSYLIPGKMSPSIARPSSPARSDKDIDIKYNELTGKSQDAVAPSERKDEAYEILGSATVPTEVALEEDRAVLRKVDLWLMPIIVMVYFLQQLDKYAQINSAMFFHRQ